MIPPPQIGSPLWQEHALFDLPKGSGTVLVFAPLGVPAIGRESATVWLEFLQLVGCLFANGNRNANSSYGAAALVFLVGFSVVSSTQHIRLIAPIHRSAD